MDVFTRKSKQYRIIFKTQSCEVSEFCLRLTSSTHFPNPICRTTLFLITIIPLLCIVVLTSSYVLQVLIELPYTV